MVRYRCPVPLFQSIEVLTAINMFLPKRKLAFSKTVFLDVSGDVKVARILWQLVLEGTENKIIFVQKDFAPCIGARYICTCTDGLQSKQIYRFISVHV